MSSVRFDFVVEATSIGGEAVRVDGSHTDTALTGLAWSNMQTVIENGAISGAVAPIQNNPVTMWDATVGGNPATFKYMAIVVDPDNTNATALNMDVEIRVGTTVLTFQVDRNMPLVFTMQAADTTLPTGTTALASTINRVRVRNNNVVGSPAGANNLTCRVLLFN